MTESEIAELAAWIAEVGLKGRAEIAMVAGFCERLVAFGVPLARANVFIDTLHPIHEGRLFRWERGKPEATLAEYGRSTEGEAAERWRASPFYRLLDTGESLLRRRIPADGEVEFPMLRDHRAAGMTDFVAIIKRFAADGVIGEMDCVYSAWMTDDPNGFADADIAALRRLMPFLGLAVKSASLGRITETLVETYLGRDAGRRVLSGRIARGVSERIETVLWFSDLHNYTRISDSSPPEQIIPMLNDYADALVSAIHERSGDVLKLIGDGVLAIFPAQERSRACVAALNAATLARQSVRTLNERRVGKSLPATDTYLGLHIGEVFMAISAAKNVSTSPSSDRRSTRSAGSRRYAARSTSLC
jgi:adenylate cyclase